MDKRKDIVASLTAAFLMSILWYVSVRAEPITNYPPKNERIVAFGDSLVSGVGATRGNDLVSVLAKRIGRPIENVGVAGNTTADGLARIEEVLRRDPGITIIVLGGNDALKRVPIEDTERNLRMLFTKVQAQGGVVVYLATRGGIIGTEREALYERLSEEYGVVYVSDILSDVIFRPELMYDSIHPNDAGYAQIAERVARELDAHNLLLLPE